MFRLLAAFFIPLALFGQFWQPVDTLFNPSGITLKSFSAPFFYDVDLDGAQDIFIGNLSEYTDFYFGIKGTTPPVYQKNDSILSSVYSGGTQFTNSDYPFMADLSGDGLPDLLIGGYNGVKYYVNRGDSTNPFWAPDSTVFQNVNAVIGTDAKPVLVDIDNDGDLDLYCGIGESLFGGPEPGITMAFRNIGSAREPNFEQDNTLVTGIADVGRNSYPAFADLNANGTIDLLIGRDLQTFVYYTNTGTPESPVWTNNSSFFSFTESSTYWKNPVFVDIDNDFDLDLVYGTSNGNIYFYQNKGTPQTAQFQYNSSYFFIVKNTNSGASVSFADFDGDGDKDFISGNALGDYVYFKNYGNNSKPYFRRATAAFTNIRQESSYSKPVFYDVDKDGDYDIVSGALNGKIYTYVNNGTSFTRNDSYFGFVDVSWSSVPSFADIDGDGDDDLLVSGESSADYSLFINDGSNNYSLDNSLLSGITFPNYSSSVFADIDNDADYDLVTGRISGSINLWENIGTPSSPQWTQNTEIFAGIEVDQNAFPAITDLDGDTRKDMVIGEYNGNFSYYVNLFSATNIDDKYSSSPGWFDLSQNYPNPFNPETTIEYTLKKREHVNLKVYDLLGCEIASLINEVQEAGSCHVRFFAKNLPAGVYFYTLRTGDFSQTKKMCLLK
ncbi:MAG: T9SS type A sorting domain-containing protein [Ignavibacteriales bacterium]|nr:T9SS type A sorting domain-containing protein [Ignavibacteriales bacterium]MCF8306493.1 T9SS type A sorting domain-containing protein [Ignavibacteriales bacterium]MCF8316941.1 T9SS type A sorting domain-containing protein [Ignavibacteriales bacterium]MCF8437750.1 T9SS type A sorting domain-containing protein [Ignavibacteriales bacterium]